MGHMLYAFTQWWVGVLPVDAAGRRCFDETLADWRREAAKAKGSFAATVVSVRAMFAVFRCAVGVSLREVRLIRRSGVLVRVFLWIGGYLLTVTLMLQMTPVALELSLVSRAYLLVSLVGFILPVALLLATGLARTQKPVPALGVALAAALTGFTLLGWVLPAANRAFMEVNPRSYVTDSGVVHVVPYMPGEGLMLATMSEWRNTVPFWPPNIFRNDLTVRQLSAKVVAGPQRGGLEAAAGLSFFGAYVALCAIGPIMASASRRLPAIVRYALVIVTAALLFVEPWRQTSFGEFSLLWWLGKYWIPVIWMTTCLIAAARRDASLRIPNSQ